MTHLEILKLIETVSPDDTAKLDEIDARVHGFLNSHENIRIKHDGYYFDQGLVGPSHIPKYTRSRDQLKAIRPEGWTFQAWHPIPHPTAYCEAWKVISGGPEFKGYSKTEELAELHAIIQAIAYERKKQ